ncbi:GtrA family protein [Pediococcus acidilactici]|uniref:GtrA family protein n=1 Tax=Pediococcus acidilactici TaxID=1254 RepID=UPI00132BCAB5|nr:GtrA family protein [Pediococcus acidilactici]KAF0334999.1 GtrA family protein [Pediococcus acidilactici]KAF0346360.1 GtrA family protein [Pediococcus acidilactici]KAF0394477.1 GtrA family protein [Pediococcus acidilactici]KAF0397699.1 GtrA family protein [Pediococcus acidilactici]KAF0411183.1 GtrA family protein [Pediococcus acidilactici]
MIKQLFKKYKSLISYLFWGVVTTLVNIVVFAVLVDQLNIFYQVSNVIAWFVSVLVAYVSNKLWVFNSHTSTASDLFAEALRFFLMRAATLALDIVILYVGISLLHGNDIFVKIIDNVVVIISNYAFSKLVVFRTKKKWE